MRYQCINVFRDRVHDRYVQPGETVQINGEEEIQRLLLANCIRPMPEGPRQAPAPPLAPPPQGPAKIPAVETAAVEVGETQAQAGRKRGRRRKEHAKRAE